MIGASTFHIREATDEEVVQALGWTHALWGGEYPFDAYVQRTRCLLNTGWGQRNYRFVMGFAGDEPVTACKRYRLEWRLEGQPVPVVGFGAVFTPAEHRSNGYAAELIRAVLASERRRGTRFALLYSDIGATYYQSLGFFPYEILEGRAPSRTGEPPFRPMNRRERMAAIDAPVPGAAFMPDRSALYWDFAETKLVFELLAFVPDGADEVRGFAAVSLEKDCLWVEAAGYDEPRHAAVFWHGLQALAGARAREHVAGWLPKEAGDFGFALEPLAKPIPMVCPLSDVGIPRDAMWWGLDHF